MKSASPWPVNCQQDLPKCFSMAAIVFWKATALVFSKTVSLPLGVFVPLAWDVFVWELIRLPILFTS